MTSTDQPSRCSSGGSEDAIHAKEHSKTRTGHSVYTTPADQVVLEVVSYQAAKIAFCAFMV